MQRGQLAHFARADDGDAPVVEIAENLAGERIPRGELSAKAAGAGRTAKEFFELSCSLDPQYAAPHVALGNNYFLEACRGVRPAKEALLLAREEARKAAEKQLRGAPWRGGW